MATQTGSIDLKAAKKAHDDAEKVATNYVADISNGILVHPDNDTTNGVKITNVVEVIRGSASVAEFGASARIGMDNAARVEVSNNELVLITDEGALAFSVATGTNTKESWVVGYIDTSKQPYITNAQATYVLDSLDDCANGNQFRLIGRAAADDDLSTSGIDCKFTKGTSSTYVRDDTDDPRYNGGILSFAYDGNKTITVTVLDYPGVPDCHYWFTRLDYEKSVHVASVDVDGDLSITGNAFLSLDTTAASGTDHDLYAAINALGWASDVIV